MSEPAPQPAQPQQMQVQVPQVSLKDVDGFAKVWRKNNIILAMLDLTSKEFARDFANVVLKSFVIEQAQRIMKMQAVQQAPQAPPSQKSVITLTD
jgi:hypothetical protein